MNGQPKQNAVIFEWTASQTLRNLVGYQVHSPVCVPGSCHTCASTKLCGSSVDIRVTAVLTGRREEALLPSRIHRGRRSICFSTSGAADVSGRGLWGFLCLSVWIIVH